MGSDKNFCVLLRLGSILFLHCLVLTGWELYSLFFLYVEYYMKFLVENIKLHLWLVINAAILIWIYCHPELIETPLWVLSLLSSILLKGKDDVVREYTSNVPWYGVLLVFLVVLGLIVSAFTGFTEVLNSKLTPEHHSRFLVAALGVLLLVVYIKILVARQEGREP